jgi:hypothetical protein
MWLLYMHTHARLADSIGTIRVCLLVCCCFQVWALAIDSCIGAGPAL